MADLNLGALVPGDWAVRWSVRLALIGYFVGAAIEANRTAGPPAQRMARAAWTWGCAWYLVHVACAFHFYHGWSHAAALRHTAERTALTTGLYWDGGLWINYALTLGWIIDVAWWWLAPISRPRRPRSVSIGWHAFLWLMVFNATAVFGHGAVRWLGGVGCACLALVALRGVLALQTDK